MSDRQGKPAVMLLVHRIPYPPNKGDKIRSYHLLQYLRQHYRVFMGCFVDDPDDLQHRAFLEQLCEECCFVSLNPRWRKFISLKGFVTGQPLTLPYYASVRMQKWYDKVVAEHGVHRVVAFSSATAQFVEGQASCRIKRVMDFIDIDSDKWMQYADSKTFPMRQIYRRESRRLLAYEQKIAANFDASSFVSDQETDLFKSLAPRSAHKIYTISNGVDLDYFSPQFAGKLPFARNAAIKHLVFVGAMDYWPNEDAVRWFVDQVLPLLQKRLSVCFWIVGSNPTAGVKQLAHGESVQVTGRVEDVRNYVAAADLVVAPLRIARGIQNKVLEALAMGKPVVVTPAALEGIPAKPGTELLLAEDAVAMANQIVRLCTDSSLAKSMGQAGRHCVEAHFSWEKNLALFNKLLESGVEDDLHSSSASG